MESIAYKKLEDRVAEQARRLGAEVTLISGPVNLPAVSNIKTHVVESAADMYAAVMREITGQDIMITAAAVADYTPERIQSEKIKKQDQHIILNLQRTKDIVASVASLDNKPFIIGFAAETQNLEYYAKDKLVRKKLDMIAANWVGQAEGGFDSDLNALHIYWQKGEKVLQMTNKARLAKQLLTLIAERLDA